MCLPTAIPPSRGIWSERLGLLLSVDEEEEVIDRLMQDAALVLEGLQIDESLPLAKVDKLALLLLTGSALLFTLLDE